MRLARPRRRFQRETTVALIDVVFFLLVFFMLIGRMDATAPFDVTPPDAVSGRDMPAGGATLSVAANGRLALDGRPVDRTAAAEGLADRFARNPALRLRINAHRGSALRHVLPLVSEAEALGIRDIVLVVTRPGDV